MLNLGVVSPFQRVKNHHPFFGDILRPPIGLAPPIANLGTIKIVIVIVIFVIIVTISTIVRIIMLIRVNHVDSYHCHFHFDHY